MAWHDLRKEIADLSTIHNLNVTLPAGEITWQTKVVVSCARCDGERKTNIANFLRTPLACRRCNCRMPIAQLQSALGEKMISLHRITYHVNKHNNGRQIANCECLVCHHIFSRPVGELVSGNRGCPGCLNVQEMIVRVILCHNLGGTFLIRNRPRWMKGLELDGWNKEIAINGCTIAFEYMGRYWHKGDKNDLDKIQRKRTLCDDNNVILLVVWALADRPIWDEQLQACQKAIDEAGLEITLVLPAEDTRSHVAKAIPIEVRAQLGKINHEAIEYDSAPGRRGYVVSRCNITGLIVSQSPYSLSRIRGCAHCLRHSSRKNERYVRARQAAEVLWKARHSGQNKTLQVKLTDEMVACIRSHDSWTDAQMSEEIASRFGVRISASGVQYARSGNTHRHLNDQFPPVTKAAPRYTRDHPAVRVAIDLRKWGLSLGEISAALFDRGFKTSKGKTLSAAQVRSFLRFS
jgi:hypothetical protein